MLKKLVLSRLFLPLVKHALSPLFRNIMYKGTSLVFRIHQQPSRITWVFYFLDSWILISFQVLMSDQVEIYRVHYCNKKFCSNRDPHVLLVNDQFLKKVLVWFFSFHLHTVRFGCGSPFLDLSFNSTVDPCFPLSLLALLNEAFQYFEHCKHEHWKCTRLLLIE